MARKFVLLVVLLSCAYLSHCLDLDCRLASGPCCPCAEAQADECQADQAYFGSPQLTTQVPAEFVSLPLAVAPPATQLRWDDLVLERGASPPRDPFRRLARGLRAPPLPA